MTVPNNEVYEVEKIVGHTFKHHSKGYVVSYEIKWAGYSHEHNTVEVETDVYAPSRVLAYWKAIPDSNADKQLFRRIQSRRKNPVILPPSARTPQRNSTPPQRQRNSTPQQPQRRAPPRQQRKSTPPEQQTQSTPLEATLPKEQINAALLEELQVTRPEEQRKVTPPKEQRKPRSTQQRKPAAPKKLPQPKKSSRPQRQPQVIANDDDDDEEDDEEDEYDEQVVILSTKRKPSDYFLEEHERKRQRESNERRTSLLGDHIFAWDLEAVEVEYIGKESPDDTHLHCRVRWTNGKVTMHPLDEAREKRPDLVLDRFVLMAQQENE